MEVVYASHHPENPHGHCCDHACVQVCFGPISRRAVMNTVDKAPIIVDTSSHKQVHTYTRTHTHWTFSPGRDVSKIHLHSDISTHPLLRLNQTLHVHLQSICFILSHGWLVFIVVMKLSYICWILTGLSQEEITCWRSGVFFWTGPVNEHGDIIIVPFYLFVRINPTWRTVVMKFTTGDKYM